MYFSGRSRVVGMFAVVAAGVAMLVAGCAGGGGAAQTTSSGGSVPVSSDTGAPASMSSDGGDSTTSTDGAVQASGKLDCYKHALADAGAWNDDLVGFVGVGGAQQRCPVGGLDAIRVWVDQVDIETTHVFRITVDHKDLDKIYAANQDSPEPQHSVVVSNVQYTMADATDSPQTAGNSAADEPLLAAYLKPSADEAGGGEWASGKVDAYWDDYWQKAFGAKQTFDAYNVIWAGSPVTFTEGPVYKTTDLNPGSDPGAGSKAVSDYRHTIWFTVDPGSGGIDDVAFVKFDVTLDGKTVTVAYQNSRTLG